MEISPFYTTLSPIGAAAQKAKLELLDGKSKGWASRDHSLAFPKGKGKEKVGGDDYLALL